MGEQGSLKDEGRNLQIRLVKQKTRIHKRNAEINAMIDNPAVPEATKKEWRELRDKAYNFGRDRDEQGISVFIDQIKTVAKNMSK